LIRRLEGDQLRRLCLSAFAAVHEIRNTSFIILLYGLVWEEASEPEAVSLILYYTLGLKKLRAAYREYICVL
jgi:hypothetical protein